MDEVSTGSRTNLVPPAPSPATREQGQISDQAETKRSPFNHYRQDSPGLPRREAHTAKRTGQKIGALEGRPLFEIIVQTLIAVASQSISKLASNSTSKFRAIN